MDFFAASALQPMVEVRLELIRRKVDPRTAEANRNATTTAEELRELLKDKSCPLGHTKHSFLVVTAVPGSAARVDSSGTCCSVFAARLGLGPTTDGASLPYGLLGSSK
ncbi:MAG: hypothetical protein IPO17_15125 [Flavobacteriales bacterium]|nr:hypothetical protein [Flavobacteriales bacterium]